MKINSDTDDSETALCIIYSRAGDALVNFARRRHSSRDG